MGRLADYELAAASLPWVGGVCNEPAIPNDFKRMPWPPLQVLGEGFPQLAY